jgi:Integrase core domain.
VLYCDNGSIFSSSHLQLACARLGVALVHSIPYDSASRGKIERFFRTVRQKFLPFVEPQKIRDLVQINDYFKDWLEKEYTNEHHHGINTYPINRFMEDLKNISIKRATEEELDLAFQITLMRKVKNDSTVSVNSVLYECPTKYIGKKFR